MNAEHARTLEEKRFIIHPESMSGMKRLRSTFGELQQSYPFLSGLSFFGSRTKGTEDDFSDYDVCLFYNSDRMDERGGNRKEWLAITRNLQNELDSPIDHRIHDFFGGLRVDISKESTDSDLATFMDVTRPLLTHYADEHTVLDFMANQPTHNIMYRFFLTIGTEVYSNRSYIFDQLKALPKDEGEQYFEMLMQNLGNFERGHEQWVVTPPFTDYPQTIVEAEKYFINH